MLTRLDQFNNYQNEQAKVWTSTLQEYYEGTQELHFNVVFTTNAKFNFARPFAVLDTPLKVHWRHEDKPVKKNSKCTTWLENNFKLLDEIMKEQNLNESTELMVPEDLVKDFFVQVKKVPREPKDAIIRDLDLKTADNPGGQVTEDKEAY